MNCCPLLLQPESPLCFYIPVVNSLVVPEHDKSNHGYGSGYDRKTTGCDLSLVISFAANEKAALRSVTQVGIRNPVIWW
ncbi:hypothetical protein IAQ61_005626 [Plenodomus lingam]|uniref:uncharacterized protein n=1 Tax=Leptosphaeria maculans TaxID=5022 RepID=UPI0033185EAF|nr:hypothetical protein IAQ61_005626 [Plenodomus lingam]